MLSRFNYFADVEEITIHKSSTDGMMISGEFWMIYAMDWCDQ